jgi:CheY-like chemotaxis protein
MEVSEAVTSAIEMASPLLEQRRHKIEVNVAREGLRVEADPERLAQVLLNLLTNAAKYSDVGSRIRVEAMRLERRISVSVRDEGVGISAEMLDKVFDLFVQQPQTLERSKGGLGLGLAIVRNLVEMHEGSVTVNSAGAGKGSEFVIELPALEYGAMKQRERAQHGVGPAEPGPGARIMVVDDNADAAEMVTYALQTMGYTVAAAPDGPSALEVLKTFRPEVALIDIGLPVMDGYELAQRLREGSSEGRVLKLVAVTGYGLEADRMRAREAGFDAYLVKPVDVERLAQVCRQLSPNAWAGLSDSS